MVTTRWTYDLMCHWDPVQIKFLLKKQKMYAFNKANTIMGAATQNFFELINEMAQRKM